MTESRRILISGVSSGIGAALAEEYLKQGWEVYGLSRRPPLLSQVHHISVDLSKKSQVESLLPAFLEGLRSFDLVVLNAGVLGRIDDLQKSSLEELKSTMEINLWANKTLLDILLKSCSIKQVVAISSGAAVNGNRGWSGYALSKAAFKMLIQLYAAEAPETHFANFAPGLVDTNMQDYLCHVENTADFQSLKRLQSARGTEAMPSPEQLALKLPSLFSSLPTMMESGEYIDIRKI